MYMYMYTVFICGHPVLFLQTTKLNVYKNDEMTWDFTSQGTLQAHAVVLPNPVDSVDFGGL